MFNDTIRASKLVNSELSELRSVALQNRQALDVMLADLVAYPCYVYHYYNCNFLMLRYSMFACSCIYTAILLSLNHPIRFS